MKKIIPAVLSFIILLSYTHCFAAAEQELFKAGVSLFNQGKYAEAVEQFSELISAYPNNADAYNNRGASYISLKQFDLAIKDFEEVKKINPDMEGLYSNIGTALYHKGDYEKALLNYNTELDKDAGNYLAHFNRALCFFKLHRDDEALKSIGQTIILKADFYWAHCLRGDLLVRKGKIERAVESYEDAVYLDPDKPYAKNVLAELSHQPKEQISDAPDRRKTEKQRDIAAKPVSAGSSPTEKKMSVQELSIQVGAYLSKELAADMKAKLKKAGFDAQILILQDAQDRLWHLVRSGRYASSSEAKKAASDIKQQLRTDTVIRPADNW